MVRRAGRGCETSPLRGGAKGARGVAEASPRPRRAEAPRAGPRGAPGVRVGGRGAAL